MLVTSPLSFLNGLTIATCSCLFPVVVKVRIVLQNSNFYIWIFRFCFRSSETLNRFPRAEPSANPVVQQASLRVSIVVIPTSSFFVNDNIDPAPSIRGLEYDNSRVYMYVEGYRMSCSTTPTAANHLICLLSRSVPYWTYKLIRMDYRDMSLFSS